MKKILFFIALVCAIGLAYAVPVDEHKAQTVATNFLKTLGADGANVLNAGITNITDRTPFHEFYVFAGTNNKGFVLVSKDDSSYPILGYSTNSRFETENIPEHVLAWFQGYERDIKECSESGAPVPTEITQEWDNLANGITSPAPLYASVSPLLSTTWDQSPYYNNLCPIYSGSTRCITGCVATATAQVMKYWNWPTTGWGSHSYSTSYGTLSANFGGTTYAWSSMPNALSSSSSSTAINAVATLMYHVGVAVEMNYGLSSEAATLSRNAGITSATAENALKLYFKYKPTSHGIYKEDHTNDQWCSILRNELDNRRPIIYSAGRDDGSGGHAFVLDGYDATGRFHVNWGWSGSCDGYFTMGALNPYSGCAYNARNAAIIGIEPNRSTSTTCSVTANVNNSSYGSVSGSGSYTPYTDAVTLTANSNSGYRFKKWSDECYDNPREFLATPGSYTFTAINESISGDTMGYCSNIYNGGLGYSGGSCYWGIRLPSSTISANSTLTAVQLFIPENGTYQVKIYTGSTPTTLLHTQNFGSYTIGSWNTLTLTTPVAIPSNQDVWVVMYATGAIYPAAVSVGWSGNPHGAYLGGSTGSSWSLLGTYGYNNDWMIRAIFHSQPCTDIPNYDFSRTVSTSWGTHSSSTTANCWKIYRFSVSPDYQYTFKTGCGDGASASFDTKLTLYNASGSQLASNDDACGTQSSITYTPTQSGYVYLKVAGHGSAYGSYTLAYKKESNTPTYTITALSNPTAGGTATVNNQSSVSVASGTSVTLRATANTGYHFNQWNDGSTANPRTITVSGNATYTAQFALDSYTISATPNPTNGGTVTGAGTYQYGRTCTLTATANANYSFVNWTSGSTTVSSNRTYSFVVNSNRTLKANFRYTQACGISASDLPYTDNFDSYTTSTTAKTGVEPTCWTLAHQDVAMTDEYKPMIYYASANAHSGNYSLILNKRGIYAMPKFEGNVNTLQLSMYVKQSSTAYQLQVGVMSDLNNASTFVPVTTINNATTNAELVTVDFSGYTGSGKYIAFRNTNSSASSVWGINYIDDIKLELNPAICSIKIADLPYTDNFDGYTTSTTAKTGVEPTCWTLAHQDVAMTDEYKPMIYYASANAHSGNYSLILNKRGIYAMPKFEGNVNTLQLSMYVKQSSTAYQLQVGVMSNLNNASTFVPVATINNATTNAEFVTVDFSGYTGNGKYIAFRNTNSSATSAWGINYIDDLTLSVAPPHCTPLTVADLPYTDNFDGYTTSTTAKTGVEPTCWTLAHKDVSYTDEYRPMIYYAAENAHSGSYSLILNKRGIYAMPEFDGNVSTLQLSMYVKQSSTAYQLQVGVMSNLNNASTFVPVATINNATTNAEFVTVDFSGYTGNGKYIAFRNTNSSATSAWGINYIDDLTLSVAPPHCTPLTVADLPYTDNFDGYTTSTTAKTGVEPDCWTLAHKDVSYTDEYRPMIYYAAENAHSGSYSLILNKRGIYAMPEFDGNVSTLQLSMYVKQSSTAYQLQVGVMSNLNNASTFVPVATINNATTNAEFVTVDFSGYTGNGKYIAFRNTNSSATSVWGINYIDDLTLSVAPPHCTPLTVADLPYTDNFDGYTTSTTAKTGVEPDCWTLAHKDVSYTDEYRPMIYYAAENAHSGSYSLILNKRGIYAMPEFDGNVSTLQLSMYVKQSSTAYQLQVGVMSNLNNASTFVPVATINNATTNAEFVTVDFSGYTGNGKYIAFRNTNSSATSVWGINYIDDLTLSVAPPHCTPITAADLPYTDNFDGYTTSTTAKTGVEPDCWTLALEEVSMTDEYKPMIYYNSSNAHSGSYSLILNKRCIYAMPEVDTNISALKLSFYLKQTKSNYQLTVGVMSDLDNPNSFVPISEINNTTTSSVYHEVNFSSYTGAGRYIAFRNTNTAISDYSINYIDDITLDIACGIRAADLPYSDNFDNYTTSTTPKTGVEPPCWTLAYREVTMTDDYVPMIYYSSANAHSGNYSLILNKRCMYAMPQLHTSVRNLSLSFYLKQTKSSYGLVVGVMSDLNNPNSFVPVASINNTSTTSSVHHVVNFSNYTGNGKYIVFRNTNSAISDYGINYIDDIVLSATNQNSDHLDQTTQDDTEVSQDGTSDNYMSITEQNVHSVYPNPTSGLLTVVANDVLKIEVYDYTGRIVAVFTETNNIDISNLPTGIYALRIVTSGCTEIQKVIKQ